MVIIRVPQAVYKIIKSADTGSITGFESTEDCVKRIYFKLGSPFSQRCDLKVNGKKVRTLHRGRSSWCRTEFRIFISHKSIGER